VFWKDEAAADDEWCDGDSDDDLCEEVCGTKGQKAAGGWRESGGGEDDDNERRRRRRGVSY